MYKSLTCLAALGAWTLLACGGSGGGGAKPPVLSGSVGPDGAALVVTDFSSKYAGLTVSIPAGAVTAATNVEVRAVEHPLIPGSMYAFDLTPSGLAMNVPCRVTIPLDSSALGDIASESPSDLVFVHESESGETEVLTPEGVDRTSGLVTASISHFSRVYVYTTSLYHSVCRQDTAIHTTFSVRVDHEKLRVVLGTHSTGARVVQENLGYGTDEDFWQSSRALLLVHGLGADAATFSNPGGLRDAMKQRFDHIAIFQYRTGSDVATSGTKLAQLIEANAGAGFRCSIVAHSLGGLVARYAIEHFPDTVATRTEALVTLSTPHAGADHDLLFAAWGVLPCNGSQPYLESGLDLPSAIVPEPPYFLVGCVKSGSTTDDGWVAPSSAEGLGWVPSVQKHTFTGMDHHQVHEQAQSNGVKELLFTWLAETQVPQVTSPAVTIDGVVWSSEWAAAWGSYEMFGSGTGGSPIYANVRMMHDGEFLYVAVATSLASGTDSTASLSIDGDSSCDWNGGTQSPFVDISVQKGAPGALASYTKYQALTFPAFDPVPVTVVPGAGEQRASAGSSQVSYEFKVPLVDLGLLGSGSGGGGGGGGTPAILASPRALTEAQGLPVRLVIALSSGGTGAWYWPVSDPPAAGTPPIPQHPAVWRRLLLLGLSGGSGAGGGGGGG